MHPPVSGSRELLLGDWRMFTDPLGGAQRQYRRMGPVVLQRWAPDWAQPRIANLYGPDANQLVLQNRDGIFSNKRAWDIFIGRIFPNGLMLRDGDDHRQHRQIMQAGFRKSALMSYLDIMNPLIDQRLAELELRETSISAHHFLKLMTLELGWHVFVGVPTGSDGERLNQAFETAVAASMALVRLVVPPFLLWRGIRAREFLVRYFEERLPEKKAHAGRDMFSILAAAEGEAGERYADAEIVDHMVFMMMAAHDTTTSTLTSMLYALGKNPIWQERCREEVRALHQSALSFDDQDRLPLLGLTMKEALRRRPPLPVFPKVNTAPFEHAGFEIPARSIVTLHPIHTHHMPEYWSDPFRFDPERFAGARAEHKQHKYLWIPFSGGAHMCIGLRFAEMQIKAILVQLLQRFRWSLPESYHMPVQQAPISKPRDGLPIRFERIAPDPRGAA
jgi:cytochrome P450